MPCRIFQSVGTLTVAEDNSTGNKAIGASVQAVSAKIVSVFYPFEQNGTPPNISISGTNDNITVSFLFEDNTTESVNITPDKYSVGTIKTIRMNVYKNAIINVIKEIAQKYINQ